MTKSNGYHAWNRLTYTVTVDAGLGALDSHHNSNNLLNQITSRDVPGYVNVLGSAKTNATVSLWSPQSTAQFAATTRKGEYYRGELPLNNNTGAVWMQITNLAVLQNGANPDILTNSIGNVFVPKTAEVFQYDRDGNLTNDGRWTYTWDAENRIIAMTSLSSAPPGSKRKVEFAYDSKGRRIQKISSTWDGSSYVAQSTSRFVYDGWNLIAILNAQSSILQSFTWGLDLSGSEQGAGGVGGLLAVNDVANGAHFCAYDGNGNLTALMKATDGAVTANYEYGPFGEALRLTGAMAKANPFRFSTKYQDDESDLVYYGYRSYNPNLGRWLNRDPIEEKGGLNLYAIVWNDPVRRIDPIGLEGGAGFVAKLNCLCTCGPFKCSSAAQLAQDALAEAGRRYPGSVHNGPGDAFRHCLWNCEMARAIGQRCAKFIAWDHENEGDRRGQPPEERKMDESNNASGQGLASQSGDCGDLCRTALDDGKLTVLNP